MDPSALASVLGHSLPRTLEVPSVPGLTSGSCDTGGAVGTQAAREGGKAPGLSQRGGCSWRVLPTPCTPCAGGPQPGAENRAVLSSCCVPPSASPSTP